MYDFSVQPTMLRAHLKFRQTFDIYCRLLLDSPSSARGIPSVLVVDSGR